ncbi:hypothetical protein [Streptomyces virginiae]|uniref:hypothetical protein n=1 Tax=Streptomyces virginiae TaxID=1961 RepID=UPI00324D71E6
MAQVVLVHGIFNHIRGVTPEEAAEHRAAEQRPRLAGALARLGLPAPPTVMAYYADLLATGLPPQAQAAGDGPSLEDLDEQGLADAVEWLAAAGVAVPPGAHNRALKPVRQLIGDLVDGRGGRLTEAARTLMIRRLERLVAGSLLEVKTYTTRPEPRRLVRERVAEAIRREAPAVVIAHSLGSYVTYETLHAHPDLTVDLLVTVGSPLRVPTLARRLEPALREGRGARPSGVGRWVNLADVGDIVAVPPKLGEVFPVDADETCDNGLGFHGLGGYLANGLLTAAIAPYLG